MDDSQGGKNIKVTYDDIKDLPCTYHSKFEKCTHTNRQCRINEDMKKDPEAGYRASKNNKRKVRKEAAKEAKADDSSSSDQGEEPAKAKKNGKLPRVKENFVTFLVTPSAKKEKAIWKELNATMPVVPQYAT